MSRVLAAASALATALCMSVPARAQDTADLDALLGESVSTTASKSAQASTAVPALSVNISAEDLRRHGIRTLGEAYNFLALGIVSEEPLGEVEVGARGVLLPYDAGKHILLLIDGHVTNDQQNGASYHSQSAGIPIELIDHIEIMLGPGSVLYGSNAMLGVVNVVTKRAKDYAGVHLIAEAGLALPQNREHQLDSPALSSQYLKDLGQSYRVGIGLGQRFRLFGNAAELSGQIEYFALDGPRFGWAPIYEGNFNFGPRTPRGTWVGETRQSYYEQTPSGYIRLQSGDVQLTLHGVSTHSSSPYSRVQEFARDFDDPASYNDRRYAGLDLSWSEAVSSALSVVARVYGDASHESSQIRSSTFQGCLSSEPNGCTHTSQGHAEWAGAELQTTLGWLRDRSMSTMVGAEGRVRSVGFESGIKDLVTGQPTSTFGHYAETRAVAAVYAQQIYSPSPALSLNAGARLDLDDRFGQRLSPRAAAAIEVWHGGTVKVIYSEAFRAPTPEELHLTNRYLVLAAPGLLPETVRSAEALLQQRFGAQRMTFGVFRSWWDNMVLRQHLSQAELSAGQRAGVLNSSTVSVFQYRNAARINAYGLEASYEGTAVDGALSYGANVTEAHSAVDSSEGTKLMTVIPSIYGNVHAAYGLGGGLPTVGLASQISDERLADNSEDPGVQPRMASPMLDLRLTFSGAMPRVPHLQYRLTADYAFTQTNPYAANAGANDKNNVELIPYQRTLMLIGLQYDFK